MENRKVIIIGAGIGGLSAAYRLGKRGFTVEILEASNRPAGRMITMERNGDKADIGAQFYHSNYRRAFELMTALGLDSAKRYISGLIQYSLKDGSTCLYDRRNPYMKLLGPSGNLSMYRFVLRHIVFGPRIPAYRIARDLPKYDSMEVLEAFASPSDRMFREYFLTPISMGMSSGMPEWTSLYHFISMFKNVTLHKHITLTGGVASFAETLATHLPVEYEAPVQRILTERGRVAGVELADGSARKAGHVVVAVAPPAAAALLPEEMAEQRRFFESVLYAQLPMPVFFLDRPLNKNIWCYFNDPGLNRNFVFAIDQHSKAPEMSPSGKSILTGWAVHPRTLDLMKLPDEEIIKHAQEDIEIMIPGFSKYIEEVRVHRHSFVNALYPPGAYRSVLDFLKKTPELQGVSFVSSALGGTCIEAAMVSAADAVKRICGWGCMNLYEPAEEKAMMGERQ
ncbi:MAG: FAD-dependent oxidoreductase [Candidatus Abyssobacteria bacterium SURF_5]|uniref:FAD-dependent oxidoreductase n=1 Tax=Abyssobacteria bacterium (strain SURF_5) TaxID=2093360 RepID=A0A3A4NCC3_ABYX5|nr:MAG: FAD-dependent oxidoreductase [Candidatus Abyssubacteria bacterium SURF_5]